MPLYEYQCESCAKRFERIQKYSDPPIEVCPSCGARVKKLMSSPAIQFKGSGFYITDYPKKTQSEKKAADGGGDKSEGKTSTTDTSTTSSSPASDTSTKSESSKKD